MNMAILTLDNERFFLMSAKDGINIRAAVHAAVEQAKSDKIRTSFADIPATYLSKKGLTMQPFADVIEMDDEPLYKGKAEALGIDTAKCCYCDHCEGSHCSRYGSINPKDEACDHFASERGYLLVAVDQKNPSNAETIVQFYCSELEAPDETSEEEALAIEALLDMDEDIAARATALPEGYELVVERIKD